jgi:hypothetical protein
MMAPVHTVIPIHDESACKGVPVLRVVEPRLEGPPEQVAAIVRTLKPLVDAELGTEVPAGAWLRGLQVLPGEAVMTIAPNLACRGHAVAQLAFDVLRFQLPDTDIYVGAAPTEPAGRAAAG